MGLFKRIPFHIPKQGRPFHKFKTVDPKPLTTYHERNKPVRISNKDRLRLTRRGNPRTEVCAKCGEPILWEEGVVFGGGYIHPECSDSRKFRRYRRSDID